MTRPVSQLSDDAKGLFSCIWGMPIGEATILKFSMQENRPTARAQKALDELTEAGYLWRDALPGGGQSYRPLGPRITNYRKYVKLGKFPLVEQIERVG